MLLSERIWKGYIHMGPVVWNPGKRQNYGDREKICSCQGLVREWKPLHRGWLFCDPMDYTDPGILQAKILEWVALAFSRGSSQPRDGTQLSHIAGGFFTSWAIRPGRRGEESLGPWSYSIRHCNGGHRSLYVCPLTEGTAPRVNHSMDCELGG